MKKMILTYDYLVHRFACQQSEAKDKTERQQKVCDTLLSAADRVVELTGPSSREQSLAITKLEEAMFWANAAIFREITAPEE